MNAAATFTAGGKTFTLDTVAADSATATGPRGATHMILRSNILADVWIMVGRSTRQAYRLTRTGDTFAEVTR